MLKIIYLHAKGHPYIFNTSNRTENVWRSLCKYNLKLFSFYMRKNFLVERLIGFIVFRLCFTGIDQNL